jgi:hypothetical protein
MPPLTLVIAVALSLVPFYLALTALGACTGGTSLLWTSIGLWIVAAGVAGLPAYRMAAVIGVAGFAVFLTGYFLFAAAGCIF